MKGSTFRLAAVVGLVAVMAAGCGQKSTEQKTSSKTSQALPAAFKGTLPEPDLKKDQKLRTEDLRTTSFDTSGYQAQKPNVADAPPIVEPDASEKKPDFRNLSPEKAAEITNAVAKLSLAEIPAKDLPKDPKVMMEINDRIRKKSEELYGKYSTTMSDVMRYISDLSPKQREAYNRRLTELFLEESRKKYPNSTVR